VSEVSTPVQYDYGKDALFRNAKRAREDLMELRRKARPASHAPAPLKRTAE
jgi:anthraniloyl-CoA monooxygenase